MNESMMVQSFVDFYKRNNRVPDSANATDPVEFGLDMWIKQQIKRHKGGGQLTPASVKILTDADCMDVYNQMMHPDHHLQEAKNFIELITQREWKAPVHTDEKTWQRPRNWFYSNVNKKKEVRDKVKKVFADAGFPNLENSQLDSNQLRQVVFVYQAIKWFKHTKKLPHTNGKSFVERRLARIITGELNDYSKFLLQHHGVVVAQPVLALPAWQPETQPSDLAARVENLEIMVTKLQSLFGDLLSVVEKLHERKRTMYNPDVNVTVAKEPIQEKVIDSSKLIGLAIVDLGGKSVTAGIENVFAYPSGAKKYILRMPCKDQEGMYDKKFWRWNSSSDIKEVTMTG